MYLLISAGCIQHLFIAAISFLVIQVAGPNVAKKASKTERAKIIHYCFHGNLSDSVVSVNTSSYLVIVQPITTPIKTPNMQADSTSTSASQKKRSLILVLVTPIERRTPISLYCSRRFALILALSEKKQTNIIMAIQPLKIMSRYEIILSALSLLVVESSMEINHESPFSSQAVVNSAYICNDVSISAESLSLIMSVLQTISSMASSAKYEYEGMLMRKGMSGDAVGLVLVDSLVNHGYRCRDHNGCF